MKLNFKLNVDKTVSTIKNSNFVYPYSISLWLIKTIPSFIKKISLKKETIIIHTTSDNLLNLLLFLKNHNSLKFQSLINLTAVDYINKKNRFEVNYFLLSILLNLRIQLKVYTNKLILLPSVTSLFNSANWYERETWDMFGIFFSNHPDLRRILTDYGFEGFPFRKDFPQSGYVQVQYDDIKKYIVYKPLKISQEYRLFNFTSPWLKTK